MFIVSVPYIMCTSCDCLSWVRAGGQICHIQTQKYVAMICIVMVSAETLQEWQNVCQIMSLALLTDRSVIVKVLYLVSSTCFAYSQRDCQYGISTKFSWKQTTIWVEVKVIAVAWARHCQSTESLTQGNADGHQLVYPVGAKNDSRLFAAAA